jgi:RES domain-containing protein
MVMTELTYEEWSEKNPIDWEKIYNTGNEDCLITKQFVEYWHHQEYLMECKKEEEKTND